MIFEWDSVKSAKNMRERGLPFEVGVAVFDSPTLEVPDTRYNYGETRIKAVGIVRGIVLVCVYNDRGETRRIISLRVANRKERNAYRSAHPG
ncbi:MAG: BrnT family toxin [Proteobacteria bacterium]|nr:BrnT family toxin [Pseudomonadota bacterium]